MEVVITGGGQTRNTMTTFPNFPRLIKGGIVLLDPNTGTVQRIISLQYNPDSLTRTLQVHGAKIGKAVITRRRCG